jgi:hypothetical protein
VSRPLIFVLLACLLGLGAAACGGSSKKAASSSPLQSLRLCLRHHGYAITPEAPAVRGTAPRSFEFVTVWNLLNPDRVALAMTISKTPAGAMRAAIWTRKTNARIAKGAVKAPVVHFGRVNVLWTTEPDAVDKSAIYGCVRASSVP